MRPGREIDTLESPAKSLHTKYAVHENAALAICITVLKMSEKLNLLRDVAQNTDSPTKDATLH